MPEQRSGETVKVLTVFLILNYNLLNIKFVAQRKIYFLNINNNRKILFLCYEWKAKHSKINYNNNIRNKVNKNFFSAKLSKLL